MFRIMWNGISGMAAEQEKLDAISNNIANMSTTGYKSEDVGFSDLLYETLNRNGVPVTNNDKNRYVGSGVKADNWLRDKNQGPVNNTGVNTDFCINGKGYFRVTTYDGSEAYERNGNFQINADGKLTDGNGNMLDVDYSVDPNTVHLTNDNFTVSRDGILSVKDDASGNYTSVGKINIYDAVGDDSMVSAGDNLFVPADGVQVFQRNDSQIEQGCLEGSNVDLGTEITDMIVAQRALEMSSKSVQTADSMWGLVNNLRR
ncbi:MULTISPECIES: flagellar hook-basal body complex protein [Clostridium]|uniref:flagellar hook-basal body complex protein n=1 Tax=Clostridium TaxID=1485 RepID=UPI0008259E77|nr:MULTISPECIES: flagellar hook-basal body complex protein [Clostridium]PJI09886.1 flagellar basal body rod protein FlgG [Clostridium sp. CT7]